MLLDQGVHKIEKKKKHVQCVFQFLKLNISSVKELLHKPSEIQWNITGALPGKLKRNIYWALSFKILPPEITTTWEIAVLGGALEAWEPMQNFIVFYDCEFQKVSASFFWLKTVLTLNWDFSLIFNIFQGVSSEKTFYIQITIVSGDIDAKKTRKTFHKLYIKFFRNASLWILHFYEQLWFKIFVKIHFQVVKVEKIAFL